MLSRSRWWLTTSRCFAGLSFKGFWAAALLVVLKAVGLPLADVTVFAAVAVLIVVGPFAVGTVTATLFERRNEAEEPLTPPERRRRHRRIVGGFIFPLLAGPVTIAISIGLTRLHWKSVEADLERQNNRPIVAGAHVGFCAPPRYLIRAGVPAVELTVRLPHGGGYNGYSMAVDAAGRGCTGNWGDFLDGGLQTIVIELNERDGAALAPRDVTWPVTVHQFMVRNDYRDGDPRADGWYDSRHSSKGLAMIQGPATR